MARVRLTTGVLDDLERIVDHLRRHDVEDAEVRAGEITSAFDVLVANPLIGRPAGDDKRELVIGRASHGYIALYRYVPLLEVVLILAVRAQRESGYARPD